MRKKDKQITILGFAVVVIVIICFIFMQANVDISPGRGFGCTTYTSKDSMLIANRHMGYVNYKLFSELMTKICRETVTVIEEDGDSAYFSVREPKDLFGDNYEDKASWIRQYKNLPITITENGFKARLETIDSIVYVYIPYQILSSITRLTKDANEKNDGIDSEERQTLKKGKQTYVFDGKIQTEGIVRQNVIDILSKYSNNLSQEKQLEVLWRYAKDNWNYMNDPYSATDTWRSVEETINDYYFVNGSRYTGDCDDFAILMASFARQVGYPTSIIAVYNNDGGHAYAEYYNGKNWVPMDWFSNELGGRPYQGDKVVIYRDKV